MSYTAFGNQFIGEIVSGIDSAERFVLGKKKGVDKREAVVRDILGQIETSIRHAPPGKEDTSGLLMLLAEDEDTRAALVALVDGLVGWFNHVEKCQRDYEMSAITRSVSATN